MDVAVRALSFIVRVSVDPSGRVAGTVERVRTGEKRRFDDIDAIGAVIGRMMTATDEDPQR
jgi:hypothetical protein